MITSNVYRTHLPAFADAKRFPDASIAYYLALAGLLMNQDRWGPPSPFAGLTAVPHAGALGNGYVAGDLLSVVGGQPYAAGSVFLPPAQITVDTIGGGGSIATAHASAFGSYALLPTPAGAGGIPISGGTGNGAQFDLTWLYGPTGLFDYGQELFAAHNLTLDTRAGDEANKGNVPGWSRGMINNTSVDKASVGYDTASAMEEGAGHWNLTTWGVRFRRMMMMVGAGAVQIVSADQLSCLGGVGAWSGPPFALFPNPSN